MPAGPWLGPAIAGGAAIFGGFLGNQQARAESRRNRQFQERMRNTQWQAAVADMEQAGLNPAIAYSQGPAASPGGSMAAQADPVSQGVSSAMAMRRMDEDIKNVKANTAKTIHEGHTARNLSEKTQLDLDFTRARWNYYFRRTEDGKWEPRESLGKMHEAELNRILAETTRAQGMASITGLGGAAADAAKPLMTTVKNLGEFSAQGYDAIRDVGRRILGMRDETIEAVYGVSRRELQQVLDRMQQHQRRATMRTIGGN